MKRIVTSLLLIPAILGVVLFGPGWLLFAVTALVAVLCYSEYCGIAAGYRIGRLGPLGYGAGLLVLAVNPQDGMLVFILLALLALVLSLRNGDFEQALPQAAILLLGIVYVFGGWKFAILLRAESPHWLAYALLVSWVGDTCGYYVGRRLGRHKLAPRISPQKSWEGAAASLVGSLIFGVLYLGRAMPAVSPLAAVTLSLAANAAGQVGDLAESALKRGAGIKDSSSLLPGHGGWLDRVDSALFAMPVVYLKLYLSSTVSSLP